MLRDIDIYELEEMAEHGCLDRSCSICPISFYHGKKKDDNSKVICPILSVSYSDIYADNGTLDPEMTFLSANEASRILIEEFLLKKEKA